MTDDELNEIEARQSAGDVPALVAEVRRLRSSSPAWHDRPTGPGLWYIPGAWIRLQEITESHLREFPNLLQEWHMGRVFGPIPADEGAQA